MEMLVYILVAIVIMIILFKIAKTMIKFVLLLIAIGLVIFFLIGKDGSPVTGHGKGQPFCQCDTVGR
jgi:uncharacterized membrane protein YeiH